MTGIRMFEIENILCQNENLSNADKDADPESSIY